ncbi:DUF6215 domain-containing protein [Streptomyces sp. NPDC007084]|uniref:DUF6215 domain-containing protein n=1 Tax=Streptomyces sp. NPDC007084 TaxID=3154313 RepID=UPI0034539C2E
MAESAAASDKTMSAGGQAVAAVLMVGLVAACITVLAHVLPQNQAVAEPATCSKEDHRLPAKYVSGTQLCTALNRPDLPTLLGTPDEQAASASAGGGWVTVAGDGKFASPEAEVTLASYSVKLSTSYDTFSVGEMSGLLGRSAEPREVLGHPAVLYSDRTIAITFGPGRKADTGPGGVARSLMIAKDPKDGGGSYQVVIWRQDDVPPDDAALFRVAEAVLPTVPGWTAGRTAG